MAIKDFGIEMTSSVGLSPILASKIPTPDEVDAAIEHLDFAIADMKMQPALERALGHGGC